jgi:LuxR family transcriptional regulator, maltose regulon positive regulatory protein
MIKIIRPTPKDVYLRQGLFNRLDHLRRFPVIWISAPAGSGKTTLISSYIGDRNIPCLWYQLDKGDADLATFFYFMREASKKAAPRKRLSLPLFTPEYQKGRFTFVLRYFERLYDRLKPPFILVFDNYQEVPPDAPLQEAMSSALSMIPEGINVIVISRNDLPASLSRLKANRTVGSVQWEDIRLTEKEVKGIIKRGVDISPPAKTMRQLYQLSDGWAAGFLLLYEAHRKGTLTPEFTGKRIFEGVFEYFAAEIFRHLDANIQEFFLTTAFLPKMTVPMAEALTGDQAAGGILAALNRNNYFIISHGGIKGIYEYHPLYRYFLLSRAREVFSPRRLSRVRRAAAVILEKAGMTEEAVNLLKDISDWKAMADIIISHAREMLKQGRHRPLQMWLGSLPEGTKDRNPWLLYWEGMSFLPFYPGQAEPLFKKAFTGFQNSGDATGAMLAAAGVINSIINCYDNFSTLDQWYTALNGLAQRTGEFLDEETEASVVASLITAAILSERDPGELDILEQRALNIKETPSTINTKAQALRWAFTRRLIWSGGEHDALPLLHELKRLSQVSGAHPLLSIIFRSLEFQYQTCNGSHEGLVEAARKLLDLSKETGIHTEDLWTYVHTAASFISRLDVEGGLKWLDGIPLAAEGCPNWVKVFYHLQLMRIALIRKEHGQALQEGKSALDFANRAGLQEGIIGTQLLLSQLYHLTGKRRDSFKLLEKVRSYALMKDSPPIMMAILRTDAQFAFDEGDDDRGLSLLGKSLSMACEAGHLAIHFDNPVKTIELCEKALEAGIEVEFVREIIRSRGFVPQTPPFHIENWPWPLKIYTLGRFTIVKAGAALQSSGKAQQMPLRLLKVLISLGGREVSEVEVSELLWPDAEGDMAHHSFENNLHRLRKLLGHAEALRFSNGKITIDGRYCWVDVWAFERLAARSDECERLGKTDKAWELMEKALALYRQDFLISDNHEAWVLSPSERLKAKYFKRLLQLGSSLESEGHIERAFRLYERGLEIDDCMEELYQRLMACYRTLGKRGQALALYDRCRRILYSTLGIEPSDETEAIRSSILSG